MITFITLAYRRLEHLSKQGDWLRQRGFGSGEFRQIVVCDHSEAEAVRRFDNPLRVVLTIRIELPLNKAYCLNRATKYIDGKR